MIARIADCFDELVDCNIRRRQVGIAEREVDHILARTPQLHLQRVDLRMHGNQLDLPALMCDYGKVRSAAAVMPRGTDWWAKLYGGAESATPAKA